MRGLHRPRYRSLAMSALRGHPGAKPEQVKNPGPLFHEAQARQKALDQTTVHALTCCRVRPDAGPHRTDSIFPSLGDVASFSCVHSLSGAWSTWGGAAITCRGITIECTFTTANYNPFPPFVARFLSLSPRGFFILLQPLRHPHAL